MPALKAHNPSSKGNTDLHKPIDIVKFVFFHVSHFSFTLSYYLALSNMQIQIKYSKCMQ